MAKQHRTNSLVSEIEEVLSLFKTSIQSRFDKAFSMVKLKGSERIYDYPYSVSQNADILKIVYIAKKDIESYLCLCKKVGTTPRDCESIANTGTKRQ